MSNEKESTPILLVLFFLLGAAAIFCEVMEHKESSSSSSSYSYSSYSITKDVMSDDEIEYIKEKAPKNAYKINDKDITFNIPTNITVTKNKIKVESPAENTEYEIINKVGDMYIIRDIKDGLTGTAELVNGKWVLDGGIKYK